MRYVLTIVAVLLATASQRAFAQRGVFSTPPPIAAGVDPGVWDAVLWIWLCVTIVGLLAMIIMREDKRASYDPRRR